MGVKVGPLKKRDEQRIEAFEMKCISKGIMDTEEDKRMGIGDGGNGTRTAHHDQKKEIIILWTCHEKRRRLSGERNHARHYTRSKKTREPRMWWMDNMEQWTGMPFKDLLKKTRDRRKWSRLVHEGTNPRIEDG